MANKLTGAKTKLEKNVQGWVNRRSVDYENGAESVLKDLFQGGCQSGMVGHLIYYHDTVKFFKTHKVAINKMLGEMLDEFGYSGPAELFDKKWDVSDPLCLDTANQNLLAWFAFEETARLMADKNSIEL